MATLRSDLMQDNRALYANASYRVGGHSAFALGRELLKLGSGCRFWAMAEAKRPDELARIQWASAFASRIGCPAQLMHNRLSLIAEAKLSDELANQALGGFKNLFEKSFEKGVAQILEVRIILIRALVGVA